MPVKQTIPYSFGTFLITEEKGICPLTHIAEIQDINLLNHYAQRPLRETLLRIKIQDIYLLNHYAQRPLRETLLRTNFWQQIYLT